jgi:hypothetical protein
MLLGQKCETGKRGGVGTFGIGKIKPTNAIFFLRWTLKDKKTERKQNGTECRITLHNKA